MTCRYCSAQNGEDDHRCHKCGRRLYLGGVRVENLPPPGRGAVAEAIRPLPVRPEPDVVSRVEAGHEDRPRQGMLFPSAAQQGQPRERLRIVRPTPTQELRRDLLARASGSAPAPESGRERAAYRQQRIDFPTAGNPAASARPDAGASDASIYCNAPVALPTHRLLAATIDGVLVTLGLGLFVSILYGMGAEIVVNKTTMILYAVAALVTISLYRTMWCLAGTDSIGMRWSGLQLLTFDGAKPSREERVTRMLATHVSWAAGGLGLIWSLVDEEKLAWHDHMSKTFPTLRETSTRRTHRGASAGRID